MLIDLLHPQSTWREYTISCSLKKQSQKAHFDLSHDAIELGPGKEVMFRSPTADKYIPGTIVNKATNPCSVVLEAQGKQYHQNKRAC